MIAYCNPFSAGVMHVEMNIEDARSMFESLMTVEAVVDLSNTPVNELLLFLESFIAGTMNLEVSK